jgi:putative transposase
LWVFLRQPLYRTEDVSLLAGAEVVVTKAGQQTSGLDRFFASLYGKPVPGLSCFTWSLVSTQERRSFPLRVQQSVRSEAEKVASKANAKTKPQQPSTAKRRPVRPKGSQNTPTADVTLTPELGRIAGTLEALLTLVAGYIPLTSLVLDGHVGNHNALQMARQGNLPLISKLRCAAALYFPYTGPDAGRGPHRPYGRTLAYHNIPAPCLQETTVEGHIQPCLSQAHLRHKEFAHALNVVIIVKTHRQTQTRGHVILFSSDQEIPDDTRRDDYRLRFHIECNVRDAKQYWGVEDFMHVTPTGVTNAANLAVFMVHVAYRLRAGLHPYDPDYSVLDLKADCRGYKYLEETIKLLPEKPEPVLFAKMLNQVACLGRIHASQPVFSFS